MLKHFGVWPVDIDRNNLFEEQKIFLIYLLGFIPEKDNWNFQVEYKKEMAEIMRLDKVNISREDIDLAKLQNRDISELKKDRLREEKEKKVKELNIKFGLEEKEEETKESVNIGIEGKSQHQKLMDMLQAKGLIKDKK